MIIFYNIILNNNLITGFYIADNLIKNIFIKFAVLQKIYFKLNAICDSVR